MSNSYYVATGTPGTGTFAASAPVRSEFQDIEDGFNLLPELVAGSAQRAVVAASDGLSLTYTTGKLALAGDFATTGAYAVALAAGAAVTLTLPLVNGTLATLAGTETLTNKTLTNPIINGATISGTISGSLTFSGAVTLGSTLNVTGAVTLGSTLAVTGNATFTAALTAGSLNTGGTLASGAATISGALLVSSGNLIYLGGGTSSEVALRRNATTLEVVLGNQSDYASLYAKNLTLSGLLSYGGVTLSGAVTGDAGSNMVLSGSPTLSGTTTVASINATTAYKFGGNNLALVSGNYTNLYDQAARASILLGGLGDTTNYYRNTNHSFQTVAGAATILTMNGAGVTLSVALTYGGKALAASTTGNAGGSLVSSDSPSLTTPALGVATGTSLALNGATIGANALAATGSANISGAFTAGSLNTGGTASIGGALTYGGVTLSNAVTGTGSMTLGLGDSWTAFTPTLTPSAGTFTSASATGRYKISGKYLIVSYNVIITTNGTASGYYTLTLPNSAVATANWQGDGGDNNTGKVLSVSGRSSSNTVYVFLYDGTYPGASGTTQWMTCVLEIN